VSERVADVPVVRIRSSIEEAQLGFATAGIETTSEIGEERSLFYKRQRKGMLDRVTTDDRILRAIQEPPMDTRAALRRNLCDRFNIEAIDWSLLVVNDGTRRRIDLYDPYATKLEERYATAG